MVISNRRNISKCRYTLQHPQQRVSNSSVDFTSTGTSAAARDAFNKKTLENEDKDNIKSRDVRNIGKGVTITYQHSCVKKENGSGRTLFMPYCPF